MSSILYKGDPFCNANSASSLGMVRLGVVETEEIGGRKGGKEERAQDTGIDAYLNAFNANVRFSFISAVIPPRNWIIRCNPLRCIKPVEC